MALDGIVISGMVYELNQTIAGGRISKIVQPEPDELMLTIKGERRQQYHLLISAGASLPLIYLTSKNKPAPLTAPNFCMLLRKHIGGGKILRIYQPSLERILHFEIEHLNELGDLCRKTLTVELMGKHSNIIFRGDDGKIIDSIKHISAQISSVREVLPGRPYFIPKAQEKQDPLDYRPEDFIQAVSSRPMPLAKAIYTTFTGISPMIAEEVCFRASLESSRTANSFSVQELTHLEHQFALLMEDVKRREFTPVIIVERQVPVEFGILPLTQYQDLTQIPCGSISEMLETYYASRDSFTRIRQKSSDLRRIVQTALDRNRKKYDLQLKQLKDTEKRDKFRIWGELIHTWGYQLEEGADQLLAVNYYDDNKEIKIPLDPTKTPAENAQHYFEKYNKLKRTYEASVTLIRETKEEIDYLESVSNALDIAQSEADLVQIKEELTEAGYIRRHNTGKRVKITSRPFHYLSSDGFHMYVGKNNFQNEELTFKVASGNDWWFHAKGTPGSHVIVKANGEVLPDSTFEQAARLAAWYSKNRGAEKAEVDYIQKKHIRKVAGAKPGFVIYHTNYSMLISSDITGIQEVKD